MKFLERFIKTIIANFTSRKFLMTLFGLYIEWMIYWTVIRTIYTFQDPAQLTAFVSITNHFQWACTTMLLAYLGIQTAANFSNAAQQKFEAIVGLQSTNIKEDIAERTIQQFAERYKGDPSYAPIRPDTEEPFR